jgi:hypothetical protein
MARPNIKMRLDRLTVPEYTAGRYGDWTLARVHEALERAEIFDWGYATGPQWEPNYWVVYKEADEVWMSTNRMERESHATHLGSAHGIVVVCGVGLGLFLYNVVQKPEVQRVFAVDVADSAITLVNQCAQTHNWPDWQKVQFIQKDAMELTRADLSRFDCRKEPDFLYVDIWQGLGDPNAVAQVQHVANNLSPRTVGFWGQELELMRWAIQTGLDPRRLTLDDFDAWCLRLDMVMQVRERDYLRYALVTAINQQGKVQYPKNIRQRSRGDGQVEG